VAPLFRTRCIHHRLCGSASSVLTAIAFVNGKFRPIQNRHPSTEIFATDDYVGDLYSCAKLSAHLLTVGLLGTRVKYNQNYFLFIPLFLKYSPTAQTRRWMFTVDGSNDADSRKDVPFWDLLPI